MQEFDNGELTLSLSDNFNTPWGPDVRILLGNSLSLNNTIEIINLTDISHFNGGKSFSVPNNIDINDFQFVLFYCVQFQQFWASGTWGPTVNVGGFSCEESSVNDNTGANEINICTTDGAADLIQLSNNLGEAAGEHFAYLLTNENEILQEVILNDNYNFDGGNNQAQRIYGIHFDGELIPMIGSNRSATSASGCFSHSSANDFLRILKEACSPAFECQESLTATTGWITEVSICTTDGLEDLVNLRNNLFVDPGANYAYLITDENEIVREVVLDSVYNFEGTGQIPQRVYGMSYDGSLDIALGEHRTQTTASECFIHSGGNLFLTVQTTAACATSVNEIDNLAAQVKVYPNPTTDVINVTFPNEFDANIVTIYNLLGARMLSNKVSGNQLNINLQNLSEGPYLLQISNAEQTVSRKIQVIR